MCKSEKKKCLTRAECQKKIKGDFYFTIPAIVGLTVVTALLAIVCFWGYRELPYPWEQRDLHRFVDWILLVLGVVLHLVLVLFPIVTGGYAVLLTVYTVKAMRGHILIVADELLEIEEEVPRYRGRRHRNRYYVDILHFAKTGDYELERFRNPRWDYYNCGRVFYVVTLQGRRKKPLAVYCAKEYEFCDRLDEL